MAKKDHISKKLSAQLDELWTHPYPFWAPERTKRVPDKPKKKD